MFTSVAGYETPVCLQYMIEATTKKQLGTRWQRRIEDAVNKRAHYSFTYAHEKALDGTET